MTKRKCFILISQFTIIVFLSPSFRFVFTRDQNPAVTCPYTHAHTAG